jgi:hypothetical protein
MSNNTPLRVNTRDAASYLGLKAETLKTARSTGILCGVQPPLFRRLGRHITYDRASLDRWLDQFPEQTHTNG